MFLFEWDLGDLGCIVLLAFLFSLRGVDEFFIKLPLKLASLVFLGVLIRILLSGLLLIDVLFTFFDCTCSVLFLLELFIFSTLELVFFTICVLFYLLALGLGLGKVTFAT